MNFNKIAGIISLSFALFACNTKPSEDFTKLKAFVGNDSLLNNHKYFLIISSCQCEGCSEERVNHFLTETSTQQKANTLVLLDTLNPSFKSLKDSLTYLHRRSGQLEKYDPALVNIRFIKKEADRILIIRDFNENKDSTKIASLYDR